MVSSNRTWARSRSFRCAASQAWSQSERRGCQDDRSSPQLVRRLNVGPGLAFTPIDADHSFRMCAVSTLSATTGPTTSASKRTAAYCDAAPRIIVVIANEVSPEDSALPAWFPNPVAPSPSPTVKALRSTHVNTLLFAVSERQPSLSHEVIQSCVRERRIPVVRCRLAC